MLLLQVSECISYVGLYMHLLHYICVVYTQYMCIHVCYDFRTYMLTESHRFHLLQLIFTYVRTYIHTYIKYVHNYVHVQV